ncbi:MAG: OsmC-related (seleno)protein [Nitrososphaerales archaeon]
MGLLSQEYISFIKKNPPSESRATPELEDRFTGVIRVDSQITGDLKVENKLIPSGKTILTDEPPMRGGTDTAPTPLATWVAGFGACTQVHFTKGAAELDVELESCVISTRGKFDLRHGGSFHEFIYETRIESPASVEKIKELVDYAEEGCFVLNTLKRGTKVTGTTFLNGTKILDRSYGPN